MNHNKALSTSSMRPAAPCRHSMNCTYVGCRFTHPPEFKAPPPQPCKWGSGCRRKNNCRFVHPPPLPNVDSSRSQLTRIRMPSPHTKQVDKDGYKMVQRGPARTIAPKSSNNKTKPIPVNVNGRFAALDDDEVDTDASRTHRQPSVAAAPALIGKWRTSPTLDPESQHTSGSGSGPCEPQKKKHIVPPECPANLRPPPLRRQCAQGTRMREVTFPKPMGFVGGMSKKNTTRRSWASDSDSDSDSDE